MSQDQNDLRATLIRVLQSRAVGFDAVVATCEAIIADARFNRWTATVAKAEHSNVDVLDLSERYGDLIEEQNAAWGRFLADENAEELLRSIKSIGVELETMTGK